MMLKMNWFVVLAMVVAGIINPFPQNARAHDDDDNVQVAVASIMDAIDPLSFGAYGDHRVSHVLINDAKDETRSSLSRYSLLIGYRFANWISLESQWELYEASTTEVGGGLNAIQMQLDMELSDAVGIRLGRMYIPSSVENLTGEPLTYLTVNTSMVVDMVTPSGWVDGVGLFGTFWDGIDYWAYVANGLDASGFDTANGVAGMSPDGSVRDADPSFMIRLGTAGAVEDFDKPSWGVFFYYGGANNGATVNLADVDLSITTVSGEVGGKFGAVYINALVTNTQFAGFEDIGRSINSLTGVDVQVHVDAMPKRWKRGKLRHAQLLPHARYESISSDGNLAPGRTSDKIEPERATFGLVFLPVENVGIKLDYQVNSLNGNSTNDVINAGIGWEF